MFSPPSNHGKAAVGSSIKVEIKGRKRQTLWEIVWRSVPPSDGWLDIRRMCWTSKEEEEKTDPLVLGRDTAKTDAFSAAAAATAASRISGIFSLPTPLFSSSSHGKKEEEKRFLSIPLLPPHFFFFLFFTQGRISLSLSFTPPPLLLRSGEFYYESILRLLPIFCSFHSRVPTGLFPKCEKKSEFPFCVYTFVRYC